MNLNGAHLHLMLVHFPIAGIFLTVLLLLAAWVLRNETLKLAGLCFVVLMGFAVWAAHETGEMAAGVVRGMSGIDGSDIRVHAQAAHWALRALGFNALLSAFGLFRAWKKKKLPQWLFITVTILAIWGSTVVARVGYLGGMIHHPEAKSDFVVPTPESAPVTPEK
jgi:uncharacterized membrane protein